MLRISFAKQIYATNFPITGVPQLFCDLRVEFLASGFLKIIHILSSFLPFYLSDELILNCFDYNLREEIGSRLDVYLNKLANWKDLAAIFGITSQPELRQISDTEHPTMNLLDVIAGRDVTVGQLKGALEKIERYDVLDCIDKRLIKT